MKWIWTILLMLALAQTSFADSMLVLVEGFCYLEGQSEHPGTKVKFIKVSPSAVTDSTYTQASGYFSKNVVPGIYDVEFTHNGFFSATLSNQLYTGYTTLPTQYLELSSGLSGALSGVLGPGYYRVAGEISVSAGQTLRIMPRTTLRYDGEYSLTIDGTLLAEGSAEDSIFFTTDITYGPEWRGRISFSGAISSDSRLAYCVIRKGQTGLCGGGVHCDNSSPTFTNCTIAGNSASGYYGLGGGVYCEWSSSPTFTNCTIAGNSASGYYGRGGGVYFSSSSPTLTNCTVSGNSAYYDGGGLYCDNSSPTFTNCSVSGNWAYYKGGGVYCWWYSSPTFKNCTVNGNSAYYDGGGVHCEYSSPTIKSTIITFSTGVGIRFQNSANSQVQYCDVFGNSGGNIAFFNNDTSHGPPGIGDLATTNANGDSCDQYNNTFLDPQFVDAESEDFHLGDFSPCIGAADPTSPPPLDMDDNPRPNPPGSLPDIGAYEHWRDVPLPVELTTFQTFAGDGQVTVRWRTESELDNSHFVLYKRKTGEEDFRVLAEIPGHGTTTEPHDYEFVDRFVQNNITYEYRISDVDITGRETIHEQIVSAMPSRSIAPLDFALYPNYPNPFNPTTMIRYDVKETGLVSLKIFDLLGREVVTLVNGKMLAGTHTIVWDATGLPSGVYLCRMDAGRFVGTRKTMLVK